MFAPFESITEDLGPIFGGLVNWFLPTLLVNPTFVPTISALDINTTDYFMNVRGNTAYPYLKFSDPTLTDFDVVLAPSQNQRHIVDGMSEEIRNALFSEISPNDLFVQNKQITENDVLEARSCIYAGNNVDPVTARSDGIGDVVIKSGSNVTFRAGRAIHLRSGFKVERGAIFHAISEPFPCGVQTNCRKSRPKNQKDISNNDTLTYLSPDSNNIKKESEANQKTQNDLHEPWQEILDKNIVLYPNPASENTNFYFNNPKDGKVSLALYNNYGQPVKVFFKNNNFPQGVSKINFEINGIEPGVYYYNYETEGKSTTGKLIVLK